MAACCAPKSPIASATPVSPFSISHSIPGTRSPACPKPSCPAAKHLEHLLRKQYVYGYMVFFNLNICRNNTQDVRQITEFAREHRVATDYHINETPMIEQDEHFKHLADNPTYIRPEDWREIDSLDRLDHRKEQSRLSDG